METESTLLCWLWLIASSFLPFRHSSALGVISVWNSLHPGLCGAHNFRSQFKGYFLKETPWATTLADLVALFYCLHILSHCLKLTFVFFSTLGHKHYGDRDLIPCVLRWISRPLFQPALEFCLAAFTPSLMTKGKKILRDSKKLSHAQITFDYIAWVFPGRFCYPALNWWGWVCSQGVFMPYYPFSLCTLSQHPHLPRLQDRNLAIVDFPSCLP